MPLPLAKSLSSRSRREMVCAVVSASMSGSSQPVWSTSQISIISCAAWDNGRNTGADSKHNRNNEFCGLSLGFTYYKQRYIKRHLRICWRTREKNEGGVYPSWRRWETEKRSQQRVEWVLSHPAPLWATSNWIRLNIHLHLLTVNYIEAPIEKRWWVRVCGCVFPALGAVKPVSAPVLSPSFFQSLIVSLPPPPPPLLRPTVSSVFKLARNPHLLLHLPCQSTPHGRNNAFTGVWHSHTM